MTKIVLFFIFPNIFNFFLKLFCGLIKLIIFVKIINMKTAMELALARIEMLYIEKDSVHWEMFKNDCMEKEKEQIINAHTNAYLIGEDDISVEDANEASIKYYNQTYNQKK
jgi:hypothetical protein